MQNKLASAPEGAPTPPESLIERISIRMAGDTYAVELSNDGRSFRLEIRNDVENSVIAIPTYALPWLQWAARKLETNRARRSA